ncbi:MAG: DUF751 family protein [Cyanobacteria bacterium]|nr:DUF751 family protein [Cyanobacteria bacterium CG_2015-16_32_12]NCO76922.1 DUF751 family protein [Cyanobacteria bacterium CG_2015-22_32_23]NCQ04269.1 DUF751 family protein [Cyanobacteria bacterium CG_2015-09_32_10]NCQ42909.1 DUF751 family protein [Cyanobacteria bacterium CG_2015-04_32_10]NCS85196.1 DUF751 family protein [Cyanobacteria bacterium CG_2015-02_32_10]
MEFEGFWENVLRYPRYMVSLIFGIFFFLWQQIQPLFKNPVTATVILTLIIGSFSFLYFTLKAMLGINPV